MVLLQSSKLTLPTPSSLSSPHTTTTSILFEPTTLSLAITHSNSSISLFPSYSPLSLSSSLQFPQTLIPKPSSSSTFLILQQSPNSANPNSVIFLVCGPHRAGSQILLRFYILNRITNCFSRVNRISCGSQSGFLRFEPELGVLMDAKHGVSVKVVGSVNYFAVYSVSSFKVWVFAVKMVEDEEGGGLRLMKCAVIRCSRPVWSLSISFGFLVLGEENGVRVFGLRRLVKGKMVVRRVENSNLKSGLNKLPNGDHHRKYKGGGDRGGKTRGGVDGDEATCNGGLEGKNGVAVKQTSVKYKHDNKDGGACFLALKGNEAETKSMPKVSKSVKAISIKALSQRMFLILDSHGDLHLLSIYNSGLGVDITGHVKQLPRVMKVQSLAVHLDESTTSQTIWISDGCHSVHMFTMDTENALNEADENDSNEKKSMHLPVTQVLFSSEKIQDIISISANSILILGQGSLYAHAIS
ncbi:uncharacterized protein LOC131652918 [Vicia villosa]|uniref:uncharacterized protein LOC131652918 n=1 Tax=Vicia villosa TaxID=3911 RepID=UPI00273CADF4|nr:uncharacterized protein LOC131652918 [Vicia villosa]